MAEDGYRIVLKVNAMRPYITVKVMKTSNERNVRLSINKPACVKSTTPISDIMPVVRNKKINWLESEGYILIRV